MPVRTIVARFWERVASHPEAIALRLRQGEGWVGISWGQYGAAVRAVSSGLTTLGVEPKDRVAIVAHNRPEWFFTDVACMTLGGTTVPVYATNTAAQVAYILAHSGAKLAVVEDASQLDKIEARRADLPALERVVVMDKVGMDREQIRRAGGSVLAWDALGAPGGTAFAAERAADKVAPEDLATLVYTSGTTGAPKAVMLTHENIWWTAMSAEQRLPFNDEDGARALSYLPLSHIAERMISHFLQIYYGTETWFARSFQTVLDDLKDCRPTYFFGVPRVWEKFHEGIVAKLEAADPHDRKTKLARRSIALGARVTRAEQEAVRRGGMLADARIGPLLRMEHAALDRLVLAKVRAAIGLDRCRIALSAAAPLDPEIVGFFHSIGIRVLEGYGQSEDTGPTTWNPPERVRIGTVGPAMPGVTIKLADDNEILVRGGNVSPGYLGDDAGTSELIDGEGWMHSGDVGDIDEYGYLTVTDRKKDLIITAGGKNIAPQEIEKRLQALPLVANAVVIGDGRPFLTALITFDPDKALAWAKERGLEGEAPDICRHERTLEEIERGIDEINDSLGRVETIKRFRVLDRDFSLQADEMTPTLKVKRRRVADLYADVIADMYDDDSPRSAAVSSP